QVALLDDLADVLEVAVVMPLAGVHLDERRPHRAFHDDLRVDLPLLDGQRDALDDGAELVDRPAGVDEAAEEHVAGDAGGGIEVGGGHAGLVFVAAAVSAAGSEREPEAAETAASTVRLMRAG